MKDFKELSIAHQRRRILKDAIAQIELGRVNPVQGTYMTFVDTFGLKDVQKILQNGEEQDQNCQACAKGALFAACVLNVNRVKINDDIDSGKFQSKKLKKWFTQLELDMMETAFECQIIIDTTGKLTDRFEDDEGNIECEPNELGQSCIDFGDDYEDDTDRLLAILNNTLENKTFTP